MATAGSSNGFVPQQQKPDGPRVPPVQGRGYNMQQSMMQMQFQHQMLPGGSVLLPYPNPMMPERVYQYQPGSMGQYIPNMSTQVIQTPMSYMQPSAYWSRAPIPPPQHPLPKREKPPLVIVDPNTKTAVQVSAPPPTVPAAATAAAAVVNPPVPPGYQYQPGSMGQYIPNMSTQVIQTPMSYMQPPAYRSRAPIPPPQQPPLQKREKPPLVIVDPNTKTVLQVSSFPPTVPAAATAAAAVVNPPVPPGGHPVPRPYTMPPANVSQPSKQELSSSNSVMEQFRLEMQHVLTRPQTTSPAAIGTTEVNALQLGVNCVNPGGLVASPQPVTVPIVHSDQVISLPYNTPDLVIPQGGTDLTAETVATTEPLGGPPMMSIAKEFKAKVPGGSVLLPNPNPMLPGTVYQYQPGLMGQYIPNMSTQVIQTPVSYMQPSAYRSRAPIPPPPQPLQKREKKPLVIVDPTTKTVIQVSSFPPTDPVAATAAAAVVNPPVPPGGHPVPGPYTMPPANVSQPSEQELSSSNSVTEQFRLEMQHVLTRPQTTSPAAIGTTEVNALQLGVNCVNPGGLVAAPEPDVPITVPIVHSDQVISLPYNTPDQVIPQRGTDLTAETVATTEPQGGPPMMSIAEEFKAKVELKKAEQPWQRQAELHIELTEEQKETQEVFGKIQSILNKLTPQKFQKLADATLQLKINTEERLKGVIDIIFTKALEKTNFSEVYANLCRVLAPLAVETVNAEGKPQTITFRRHLLTKCQQEFERYKQEDEERKTMQKGVETEEIRKQRQTTLEAAEVASRHRSLGNIRFIGELYKLKILSESIVHDCMIRLLRSTSDEESLECFAMLMATTGKDLDKEETKPRIDTYFNRVNDIIRKGKISSRIKCALQDVVDLRDNKWVPRQRQVTIDQIHREAEDEEQMTKQLASQYTGNSGMPPYGRRDSRPSSMEDKREGRGGQKPGEEWSKVGGEKRVQQTSKTSLDRIRNMKKEKESSGGLRAVSKWGVGSKGAGHIECSR